MQSRRAKLASPEVVEIRCAGPDVLSVRAGAVPKLVMEAGVEGQIGAWRDERGDEGKTWRNGFRDRVLDTRLGSLQLHIPKLRQGGYFPPFLEARKVSEKALIGAVHKTLIGRV